MHSFSLEKSGIVQCRYTVTMRSCLIPELYPLLVISVTGYIRYWLHPLLVIKPTIIDPCLNLNEKLVPVFESQTLDDFKLCLKRFKKENAESKEAVFIDKVFKLLLKGLMDQNIVRLMKKGESNLLHYLIWLLMQVISANVSFEVEEYKLSRSNQKRNNQKKR
ncbi:hypothetical protein EDC94DRAFT_606202 [Helicostylum pulchrum]|nr:hypothetical protein EDC94DRAFT_606202 [Helicostylum pulchrum]